jgi:hypothetical protein
VAMTSPLPAFRLNTKPVLVALTTNLPMVVLPFLFVALWGGVSKGSLY